MVAGGAQKWGQWVQVLLPRVWYKNPGEKQSDTRGRSRVKRRASVFSKTVRGRGEEGDRETGWGGADGWMVGLVEQGGGSLFGPQRGAHPLSSSFEAGRLSPSAGTPPPSSCQISSVLHLVPCYLACSI